MLLQVLLDILKRHAYHTKVALNACWVLKNMSVNAANCAALIAQGGVAAFRDVKRNHPGNGEIQEVVDGLLAALQ